MFTRDGERLARSVTGDKTRALQWLARAIPVEVREAGGEMDKDTAGQYSLWFDNIEVRGESDHPDRAGAPWVAVLAHEGLHATQYRVRRTPPMMWLKLMNEATFDRFLHKEECVTYLATYHLGQVLGFDWPEMLRRYDRLSDGADDEMKAQMVTEAEEAVEWLVNHAPKVDERPFEDDLKRWAEAASTQGELAVAA